MDRILTLAGIALVVLGCGACSSTGSSMTRGTIFVAPRFADDGSADRYLAWVDEGDPRAVEFEEALDARIGERFPCRWPSIPSAQVPEPDSAGVYAALAGLGGVADATLAAAMSEPGRLGDVRGFLDRCRAALDQHLAGHALAAPDGSFVGVRYIVVGEAGHCIYGSRVQTVAEGAEDATGQPWRVTLDDVTAHLDVYLVLTDRVPAGTASTTPLASRAGEPTTRGPSSTAYSAASRSNIASIARSSPSGSKPPGPGSPR